ncbi:hypothetical protein Agub_g9743 [Astrephomene gubernaculifera]|uniref:F-box domain-containing protein n=1 Tax=Astrephomene gubernaculifera TaxID=47775 RepID=A0AAD3DTR0_9CHLO|nr:hypothetical protein Agub_g9743 [Astrephomene gubernaculifera]
MGQPRARPKRTAGDSPGAEDGPPPSYGYWQAPPDGLFDVIVPQLTAKQFVVVQLVCKDWSRSARYCLKEAAPKRPDVDLCKLATLYPNLTQLNLSHVEGLSTRMLTPLSQLTALRELCLSNVTLQRPNSTTDAGVANAPAQCAERAAGRNAGTSPAAAGPSNRAAHLRGARPTTRPSTRARTRAAIAGSVGGSEAHTPTSPDAHIGKSPSGTARGAQGPSKHGTSAATTAAAAPATEAADLSPRHKLQKLQQPCDEPESKYTGRVADTTAGAQAAAVADGEEARGSGPAVESAGETVSPTQPPLSPASRVLGGLGDVLMRLHKLQADLCPALSAEVLCALPRLTDLTLDTLVAPGALQPLGRLRSLAVKKLANAEALDRLSSLTALLVNSDSSCASEFLPVCTRLRGLQSLTFKTSSTKVLQNPEPLCWQGFSSLTSLDLRAPAECLKPGLPALAELTCLRALALDMYCAGEEELMVTVVAPANLDSLFVSSDRSRSGGVIDVHPNPRLRSLRLRLYWTALNLVLPGGLPEPSPLPEPLSEDMRAEEDEDEDGDDGGGAGGGGLGALNFNLGAVLGGPSPDPHAAGAAGGRARRTPGGAAAAAAAAAPLGPNTRSGRRGRRSSEGNPAGLDVGPGSAGRGAAGAGAEDEERPGAWSLAMAAMAAATGGTWRRWLRRRRASSDGGGGGGGPSGGAAGADANTPANMALDGGEAARNGGDSDTVEQGNPNAAAAAVAAAAAGGQPHSSERRRRRISNPRSGGRGGATVATAAVAAATPLSGSRRASGASRRGSGAAALAAATPATSGAAGSLHTPLGTAAAAGNGGVPLPELLLEELCLDACYFLLYGSLVPLLRQYPRLTSLKLDNCLALENGELVQLCELSGLRQLSLSGLHLVSDSGLRALGRLRGLTQLRLKGLRKLAVHAAQAYMRQRPIARRHEEISGAFLPSLAPLSSLRSLTLKHLHSAREGALVSGLGALRQLTRLEVKDVPRMTDAVLAGLGRHGELREVCVLHCEAVTLRGRNALYRALGPRVALDFDGCSLPDITRPCALPTSSTQAQLIDDDQASTSNLHPRRSCQHSNLH